MQHLPNACSFLRGASTAQPPLLALSYSDSSALCVTIPRVPWLQHSVCNVPRLSVLGLPLPLHSSGCGMCRTHVFTAQVQIPAAGKSMHFCCISTEECDGEHHVEKGEKKKSVGSIGMVFYSSACFLCNWLLIMFSLQFSPDTVADAQYVLVMWPEFSWEQVFQIFQASDSPAEGQQLCLPGITAGREQTVQHVARGWGGASSAPIFLHKE